MAVTIDYLTFEISVPKSDTTFVETNPVTGLEIIEINAISFAKLIADVQDDNDGMFASTAFEFTAGKSLGGTTLADVLLILAPYTITFEDGMYAVNIVGGNTNIADRTNVNQVSIRPSNSAGLVSTSNTWTETEKDNLINDLTITKDQATLGATRSIS